MKHCPHGNVRLFCLSCSEQTMRDEAKTLARFCKASAMCDVLEAEGITVDDGPHITDEAWSIIERVARVKPSSVVTRALTLALLEDRETRRKRG